MGEFNFLFDFWRSTDKNDSMTWTVYANKISILYYFNDENINLEYILSTLNNFAPEQNLGRFGWKLPFRMQELDAEGWNRDFFKLVEFIVKS